MSGKLEKNRKSAAAVIAVIMMFVIAGTTVFHPAKAGKSMETGIAEKALKMAEQSAAPEGNLVFFAQKFDYILMYGDPKTWDDESNLCIDENGDDCSDANFAISTSRYEGIDLGGSVKQVDGSWKSMNFWSADLYGLFRDSLQEKAQARTISAKDFLPSDFSGLFSLLQGGEYIVKGGCPVDDDYVQISVCDIDEDGSDEVLASVGNRFNENVTAIYEFTEAGKTPFAYRGCINCDTVVEYRGDKTLWAYRGGRNSKLHDTYIYDGNRLEKVEMTS